MTEKIGWIKLNRKVLDHWIFKDAEYFRAWMVLLLEVNHAEKKTLVKKKLMTCKRGESLKSLNTWAKLFGGWSKSRVNRFFKLLEKANMIELKNETVTTRLTICNYNKYQDKENESETHAERKRVTNKNDKNDKNDKNIFAQHSHSENIAQIHPIKNKLISIFSSKVDVLDKNSVEKLVSDLSGDVYGEIDVCGELDKVAAWEVNKGAKLNANDFPAFLLKWMDRAKKSKKSSGTKDIHKCFSENLKKKYGNDFKVPSLSGHHNKLAINLIKSYGLECVLKAVKLFCDEWDIIVENSNGRLSGVPNIGILWSMRDRVFANVQLGKSFSNVSKLSNHREPENKPKTRASNRKNFDEYVPTDAPVSGWGDSQGLSMTCN
jgi:hypothetical protein